MKLTDLKVPGDLSLQSYVDSLVEAVNKHEDVTLIVLVARKPDQLSVIHNIDNGDALPDILSQLAAQMRKPKKSEEKHATSPHEAN